MIRITRNQTPTFDSEVKAMPLHTPVHADTLAAYPARYFAAWSQRDIEVALELFTPRLSWIDPSLPAEMTSRTEARGFFEAAWQGFPDLAFVAVGEPLVDAETGRVAHEWRMTGTHTGEGFPPGVPATGKPFDVAGTDVWQVDADGRALSVRAYYDVSTLLRQLGLA
jgi:steroid delta-isomerase-like uncharacterized protein